MVTWDEAERMAAELPEVTQGARFGHLTWFVGKKAYAWERPFSKADIKRYGDQTPPAGPIMAVSTADLNEKEAILAAGYPGVFTIEHFDGYAAVLIQLDKTTKKTLRELLHDAWLAVAPKTLAQQHFPAK